MRIADRSFRMKVIKESIRSLYTELKQKKQATWVLAVLVIVLLVTRFVNFADYVMFLGDQGRDASILLQLITFKNLPFIGAPSSIGQVYLGPFYYYLVAPFLPLFNWSPVGPAFGVALISILATLIATGLVIKRDGYLVGVTFFALLTFSLTLIDLSRFSWNPNLLPYFSFATVSMFVIWQRTRSMMSAVIFGILMGLSFQLHYLMVFTGIPIVLIFLLKLKQQSIKEKITALIQLGASLVAFFVTLSPLILFDIKHQFVNFSQLFSLVSSGGLSESDLSYIAKLSQTASSLFEHGMGINLPGWLAVVLLVLVVILGFNISKKIKSPMLAAHTLTVLTYVLGFAIISSPRLPHYYVPVYLSFYLLLACLIAFVHGKMRWIVAGTIVTIAIVAQIPQYNYLQPLDRSQIEIAKARAESFFPHITGEPIQIVTIPYTESHGHYRYYLELQGYDLLPETSPDQAKELFVMCFQDCIPQDDPQWQIAAFENKKVAEHWVIDGVTIYKIVHATQ